MHAPDDPDRKRELAAAKREYRVLIDSGGGVLDGVRVRDINGTIAALIDLGWLKEAESKSKKAQAAALGALVDDYIASRSH